MAKLEPMLKLAFPKDLRDLPDAVASEIYRYRVVGRGPARVFYKEYEDSLRARLGEKEVAFRLHDLIFFFAKAAAEGVVGNLAFSVLAKAINALRKPKQELGGNELRFEAEVSRRTYNHVRREHHPDAKPSRALSSKLEEKLETQYRLMVKLTHTPRKSGPG
jgi:hypothetical protein